MDRIRVTSEEELKEVFKQYKNIYVYGAGIVARKMLSQLQEKGNAIKALVVTEKTANEKTLLDTPIISLKDVSPDTVNNAFIIGVSDKLTEEIEKILQEKGHYNIINFQGVIFKNRDEEICQRQRLEITTRIGCKIQCKYCPQELLYKEYFKDNKDRTRELSLEDYKKCVDNTRPDAIISFAGFSEPFLHPQAVEMMRYAHESGREVELFTTLVGLTEENFDAIKDIPFVNVVLHTPDVMHYAEIPETEAYYHLLDKILEHKKLNGQPFIDSANCQSRPTELFLEKAKSRIKVSSVSGDRAGNLSDNNLNKIEHITGKIRCNRAIRQDHWVLLPDCTVVMCCMDFGLKHYIGNLKEFTYEELLKTELYSKIRKMMLEEENSIICRDCEIARKI